MLQYAWHVLFLLDKRVGFICLNCRDLKWISIDYLTSRTNMEDELGCPIATFIYMIPWYLVHIDNWKQWTEGLGTETRSNKKNINLAQSNWFTWFGMSISMGWDIDPHMCVCVSLFIHCIGYDFADDGITDFREFLTMKSQEESRILRELFQVKCMLTYPSWKTQL